jgi:hypothetical protein
VDKRDIEKAHLWRNLGTGTDEDIDLFEARKALDIHVLLIYTGLRCSISYAVCFLREPLLCKKDLNLHASSGERRQI